MRRIEVAELDLLAERSRKVAELAHLLAEAAARHAERVEAGDAERRHVCALHGSGMNIRAGDILPV